MKLFFLLFGLFLGTSAYGQNLHMIEMSTSSATLGSLSSSDNGDSSDMNINLAGNYAYKISERIQLGIQGNYALFQSGSIDNELYGVNIGGIYNFDDDLTNAFFVSLYGGMAWTKLYGNGNGSFESWRGRGAIGKRFALSKINLPNVTYSPEVSFTRTELTENGSGVNTVSIRFLQFSVFF